MRYIEDGIVQTPKVEKWITDTTTGLDWAVYNQTELPWQEALVYAESLGDGWRLPTDKELETIIDRGKLYPATELPSLLLTSYWTATEYAGSTPFAWRVSLNLGDVYITSKTTSCQVVCVRDTNPQLKK